MTFDDRTAEFPRPLKVESIGNVGRTQRSLAATAEECVALARRLGLQDVSSFSADMTLDRIPGGEIMVRGRIVADVVQTCVVTLEPVPEHVDEQFEVRFTLLPVTEETDLDIGPDDEEPPEPISGDFLDIGELAAQQLALGLDPWPRLPGATLDGTLASDPARDGPFAVLAAIRSPTPEKGE